ncbi:uncharacterized protein FMAN_00107 [Fusarium mangiferae]|uniref:CBM1 domain-containing protein n=1 Tax=Fusarium mangiferae TaxID=192010 RepID=A0A1L7U2S2_FUSMA|nr:uncharacterized protein FMAN_00107 [Fusarium mangiferae]CVL02603.1 uncharacterized protein FMAN_00107 [Fusarium mangiferae]
MHFSSLIAAIASASLASVASACQPDGTIGSSVPASNLNCCSGCAWNSYIRNNAVTYYCPSISGNQCNIIPYHG